MIHCQCCGRQIVSYPASDDKIVGGDVVAMVGGVCCRECAEDLDENGLFPEERGFVDKLIETGGE